MSPPAHHDSDAFTRFAVYGVAGIFLAGGLIRLSALGQDFWFDEILSWEIALTADSPLGILFRTPMDNNHPLTTLFIWLVGIRVEWGLYRLFSLAAGMLSIPIASIIAHRRGTAAVLTTSILFAFSFPMITYSTEARGYAPMVFFALASFALLGRSLRSQRNSIDLCCGIGFGFCVILGFLSHLEFAHFYAASLVWSAWVVFRKHDPWQRRVREFLGLHAIPIVFCLIYFFMVVRHLHILGAMETPLVEALPRYAATTLGLPEWPPLGPPALILFILLALAEIYLLTKQNDGVWIFFAMAVLVIPVLHLAFIDSKVIYLRYFLVAISFFLILLGSLLTRLLAFGIRGKILFGLALALILSGDAQRAALFLKYGRGHYREALIAIAEQTQGPVITIATDNDHRNQPLVNFYQLYLPKGKKIEFIKTPSTLDPNPEWYIVHHFNKAPPPPGEIEPFPGKRYRFVAHYPYYGLSGWHWFVYRAM